MVPGHNMLNHHVPCTVSSTCPRVRHQVQNVTRFGVDVKADVHVVSVQVDDEVGVVIHWGRNTRLVTHWSRVSLMLEIDVKIKEGQLKRVPKLTLGGRAHSSGPFSA